MLIYLRSSALIAMLWMLSSCSSRGKDTVLVAPLTLDSIIEPYARIIISDSSESPTTTVVRFFEPRNVLGHPGLLSVIYVDSRIAALEWSRDDFSGWCLPAAGMLKDSIPIDSNLKIRDHILSEKKSVLKNTQGSMHVWDLGDDRTLSFDTISQALHLSQGTRSTTGPFWFNRSLSPTMNHFLTLPFTELSQRLLTLRPYPGAVRVGELRITNVYRDTIFGIPGIICSTPIIDSQQTILWDAVPATRKLSSTATQLYELLSSSLGDPLEDNDSIVYWQGADSTIYRLYYVHNETLNLARTKGSPIRLELVKHPRSF